MGNSNEIHKTQNEFNMCQTSCALVINSTQHCSGLNLQTATDLIFAHKINDSAIESQVVGRGHRIGRTNPLNIWYLLYDNEYSSLSFTHNLRELSADELKHEAKMEQGTEQAVINSVTDNTLACYLNKK
jgi:hypothetical protein